MNTFNLRIDDCIRQKLKYLDLSNINSDDIMKQLFSHKHFKEISSNLEHLFIYECNITNLPDLDIFKKLQTLDISNNKLTTLPKLPASLNELIAKNNNLSEFMINLPNLKRLNCENNKIVKMSITNDNIERLHVRNNPIICLTPQIMPCIRYLDISNTKIISLPTCPNARVIEIEHTDIKNVPQINTLQHLICNNSKLENIVQMDKLTELEILGTNLLTIPFFPLLESLVVEQQKKQLIKLSSKYKLEYIRKNRQNNLELHFSID